jgi:SAM-dependent methyltransferase
MSHFDEVADVYDQTLPDHVVEHYLAKRTRFIVLTCPPPARLLDVGCGTGTLAERLGACGYDVTGLDPSAGMLERLQTRAPRISAVQGSATRMPFGDDEFDLSISVATMHHLGDAAAVGRALEEMVRVVRPGGRVIVWDHNPRNPYWSVLMRRLPQDRGDERLIPADELVAGLQESGAEPLQVTQLGMVPDFAPRRLIGAAAASERVAERTPVLRRTCAHNVVVAQKLGRGSPARDLDPDR